MTQVLETAMFDCQSSFVDEIRARRGRLEQLTAEAAELSRERPPVMASNNGDARSQRTVNGTAVAGANNPNLLQQTLHAERDMDERAKKLHYSLNDLGRTISSLDYMKSTWEGYLREYDIAEPGKKRAVERAVSVPPPTWWDFGWLRQWSPRTG